MNSQATRLRNPLDDLVGYQLRRASNSLMGELARDLGHLGLRPTEASVLLLVDANPGLTQVEVGREFNIKRANVTPLAASLDERGLIRRERIDGRSLALFVTEKGRVLGCKARKIMDAHDVRILSALPKTLRRDLRLGLAALW